MTIEVTDAAGAHRYEARVDGELAGTIQYRRQPDAVVLIHTEVKPRFEGKGMASFLVRYALDDLRARGDKIAPLCPFVAGYIERHPEYADLVAQSQRAQFDA